MIGFVDGRPKLEPHGDGYRLTLPSGDSAAIYMLTRAALMALLVSARAAQIDRNIADLAEPIPFPGKRRRRQVT